MSLIEWRDKPRMKNLHHQHQQKSFPFLISLNQQKIVISSHSQSTKEFSFLLPKFFTFNFVSLEEWLLSRQCSWQSNSVILLWQLWIASDEFHLNFKLIFITYSVDFNVWNFLEIVSLKIIHVLIHMNRDRRIMQSGHKINLKPEEVFEA